MHCISIDNLTACSWLLCSWYERQVDGKSKCSRWSADEPWAKNPLLTETSHAAFGDIV